MTIQEQARANAVHSRKTQLFVRAITQGVISERDTLLSYGVAEFYNEMSLFIEEVELKEKAYKEARKR